MNNEKISNILLEHFSGFILSGMVFTIFSIFLPVCLLRYLCDNPPQSQALQFLFGIIKKVNTPLFIISVIGIGILLDLLKLWRFWNQLPFFKKTWVDLKVSIVKSFDISTDEKFYDKKDYMDNVRNISRRIHKTFIKTKHPEIDRRIEINRIYHETLSMSFFSILFGLVLSILITIVYPEQEHCALVIVLMLLFVVICLVGKGKVSHELSETNRFTEALLRKTFSDDTEACLKFVEDTLSKKDLVTKNDQGGWEVKKRDK
jgi:hypothetical protein